ncbi:Acyl-coenzyme A thioesterase 13 [Psilocybe cubensis]|uniref:Acyl-coenzyme A thioesterase 13 n=2 Tax=Psilocybe cubensis TaxID=181762 RepID=A0ACB8H2I7_PSICU|nr:Acyl-coenzyme A thioesterase 13 [Psilocybe cubensis]KAH9482208.1 Acyl-coenzyme A thioesterase 13 [Psilocybe cubensis]
MATSFVPPTASSATPDFDTSKVAGNAPEEIKRILGDTRAFFAAFLKPGQKPLNSFGKDIMERMVVTELAILQKAEEPSKLEGRAVLEVDVSEDMVNGGGNIHGGCSAFLIDMASSFALTALTLYETGRLHPSVSQSLNVVYHSPAAIGDRIRLVNTTMTVGKRTESVRTEIWNVTHHRLVASGVHIKMMPSKPKANL